MPKRSVSNSHSVSPPRNRGEPKPFREPSPPKEDIAANVDKEPRLFVSVSLDTSQDDIRNLFSSCGQIVDLFHKKNDRGGIAFITFSTIQEAQKGKECNGQQLGGKRIKVDFAKPRPNNGQRGNKFQRQDNGGQRGNDRPQVCFKCNKEGHISRNCTENNDNSYGNNDRPRKCFKCNQEGHFSKDCNESNNNGSYDKPQVCFKCNKEGHISKNCNENTDHNTGNQDRPRVCFKCNKEGHISKNCTQSNNGFNNSNGDFPKRQERQQGYRNYRRQPRRERNFNRQQNKNHRPYLNEIKFPGGRQDYVYQEPTVIEKPHFRYGNRYMSEMVEEKNQNNENMLSKRNVRKRSVSGSHSPVLNRNIANINENGNHANNDKVKSGVNESKNNNASRSRSRSNERVPRRKRSVSKQNSVSF